MKTIFQTVQMMMRFNLLTKVIFFVQIFMLNVCFAESLEVTLHSEQWDMPRHGESLIKQADLTKIVRLWSSKKESYIEILYPGGEDGELWVQELMDWLVALGVPSSAMRHSQGSGGEDIIKLKIKQ